MISMKNSIHTGALTSAVFGLATMAFFGIFYPYHIHFQEQSQLFEWTWKYFIDVVRVPGGFADWCGRFLTQFCYIPWLGAAIIAALLTALHHLTAKAGNARTAAGYAFSLIPAILALIFILDHKALLGGIAALTLSIAMALPIRNAGSKTRGTIAAIICTPVMYWLCGPLAIVFVAACFIRKGGSMAGGVIAAALLAACPFILESQLHLTLKSLLLGVHYYRYLGIFPTMLWVAAGAAVLCITAGLAGLMNRADSIPAGIATAAVILAGGGLAVALSANFDDENVMHYDYLAMTEQWDGILKLERSKPADRQASACCLNLALAKSGTLGDHIFDYRQGGTSGLFPKFAKTATNPLPTSEVFWQLGMVNICQYYVFEAQEAAGDFQKSGRCYKRLAQTNIVNHDYDVARKYLNALEHTVFYRGWARKNLALLSDETSVESDPVYGRMRKLRSHVKDEIYNENRIDVILGYLVEENPANSLAMDYLLCYELLDNNLNNFRYHIQNYKADRYPRFYQEGILMSWVDSGRSLRSLPAFISESNVKRFQAFIHDVQAGLGKEQLEKKYGNTFWFHALYN